MATIQPRRNAGSAQHRVIGRIFRHNGAGFEVVGIGDQPHHRGSRFAPGQFCRLGEVGARRVGELHGKLILTDANKRRRQAVNGVIRARATAVATGVARLDTEILIDLLSRLNTE